MSRRSARTKTDANRETPVWDYEHVEARRSNNPPSGLAHLDREPTPTRTLAYDPHLDPQLVWAGKAERETVNVPAPSVHVHEELSAKKVVASVRRQRTEQPLFDVAELNPSASVEFYQHDLDWSNRMILGDSLIVMSSLLERERLAGKVQCVFMDPPYGIKYQSNFQPSIGKTAVVDGQDASLTREPEMIQAYRDTWEYGIHSYLTYLRDRLQVSRELLHDSGSVFVQISDDNLHLVRCVLDEIFGVDNFVSLISFTTTSGFAQAKGLARSGDYLLWYAKDKGAMKVRTLWREAIDRQAYNWVELPGGDRRGMKRDERSGSVLLPRGSRIYAPGDLQSQGASSSPQPFEHLGKTYLPGVNSHWKASFPEGMARLAQANRIHVAKDSIRYVRYDDDFGYQALTNLWTDTGTGNFTDPKRYVVQTNPKVIERCLQLVTDPGDLVLDPTCGGGTAAWAAEHLGRRWITIDTSRVALSIARERLLTAQFPYYQLQDPSRGVDGDMVYRQRSRTTLSSIANAEPPEMVTLVDQPQKLEGTVRVSGPFTVEALSRYSVDPLDEPAGGDHDATIDHLEVLLGALRRHGLPRPGAAPLRLEQVDLVESAGSIQATAQANLDDRRVRVGISFGPKFGAITMSQVSDALRDSIGYDLVVFAGFAVSADAQERLSAGRVGGSEVALLLANPDLLVGDLLKSAPSEQTFRPYAAPDIEVVSGEGDVRVEVLGVDMYDVATGEVDSFGKSGVQAWFLDEDYDGLVFRVNQAFFPVSNSWKKLQGTLRSTVDRELLEQLHGWESFPFASGEHARVAVRVITQDGNAAEVVREVQESA